MIDDFTLYAQTRDPELRHSLVVRHLPLLKFVARKLYRNLPDHLEFDDLLSWGSLGLMDAVEKFDPSLDYRFSTYAVVRIRGAILDGLQGYDWAPKPITSRVRHLRRAQRDLSASLGREATIAELAHHSGITEAEVRGILVDDSKTRMVTTHSHDEDDDHVMQVEDHAAAMQDIAGEMAELRLLMARAVQQLTERERVVLQKYYGENLTLKQVAEFLGVSASTVTTAHTRLVENLRLHLAMQGGAIQAMAPQPA